MAALGAPDAEVAGEATLDEAREELGRPAASPLAGPLPPGLAEQVRRFDRVVDGWFDRLRGHRLADRVLYGASAAGDFAALWHLVSAARTITGRGSRTEAGRLAAALVVESVVVNVGIKSLFGRRRPHHDHERPHRLRQPRSSSFPSGHATSGFLAAALLTDGRPRQRLLWYGLATLVASSRIHVRIHHASDVVGGAALGFAAGHLVRRRWSR